MNSTNVKDELHNLFITDKDASLPTERLRVNRALTGAIEYIEKVEKLHELLKGLNDNDEFLIPFATGNYFSESDPALLRKYYNDLNNIEGRDAGWYDISNYFDNVVDGYENDSVNVIRNRIECDIVGMRSMILEFLKPITE